MSSATAVTQPDLPDTMRAAIFDEAGSPLRLADVARPIAGPSQAVIRVEACGVCGSDLHATARPDGIAQRGGILGHELVGEIVELGPDPRGDWAIGQQVYAVPIGSCGDCPRCHLGEPELCPDQIPYGSLGPGQTPGAYAQYIAVPTSDLLAIPDGVDPEVAALSEPLATGLMCIRLAELGIGQRVLVLGAGPIGLAAVMWARFFGARSVVAADLVTSRLELARQLGATHVIDGSRTDDQATEFQLLTGGEPDIVIEAVGRPGMLDLAVSLVRERGTVITAGVCMEPDSFHHLEAYAKEPTIRAARIYTKAENEFILEMIANHRIDPSPMVSHRVSLDQLPTAFEELRRPTDQCKVLVRPNG